MSYCPRLRVAVRADVYNYDDADVGAGYVGVDGDAC